MSGPGGVHACETGTSWWALQEWHMTCSGDCGFQFAKRDGTPIEGWTSAQHAFAIAQVIAEISAGCDGSTILGGQAMRIIAL
jgi:hypothetical protein